MANFSISLQTLPSSLNKVPLLFTATTQICFTCLLFFFVKNHQFQVLTVSFCKRHSKKHWEGSNNYSQPQENINFFVYICFSHSSEAMGTLFMIQQSSKAEDYF